MDFTNINTSPNITHTPMVTDVEKKDLEAPQVAPVNTTAEANKTALGNNELHQRSPKKQKSDEPMSTEALAKIAEDIQGKLDKMGSSLGFSINKKYESLVAEISNRKSGEVIRQIPSEDVLALREKLTEVIGLFFDKKL